MSASSYQVRSSLNFFPQRLISHRYQKSCFFTTTTTTATTNIKMPTSVESRLNSIADHVASTGKTYKLAIIGSGNWGTTIGKVMAENAIAHSHIFQSQVKMWVYEELVEGRKLTEIINTEHENVRYLQGIKLPENLVACPDIVETVSDADLIVFNIPHQFLPNICKQLKGLDFSKKRAISCLKGLDVSPEGVHLLSDYIYTQLGLHCGVLSGANLAPEVAKEKYSETTVAYPLPDNFYEGDINADVIKTVFQRPYFHVRVSPDTAGVSIGGALKNVVAIAAGMVEGLGWGSNAKAAIMRRGLLEMIRFGTTFFPTCKRETFTEESAGVADLITSCDGGRNHRVGFKAAESGKSVFEVEKEILNGMSAQGIATIKEVHELLSSKKMEDEFPLFKYIYLVVYENHDIKELPQVLED